jgi:folylpolyglutamate synthase/dihydropteroate synthase
LLFPRAEAVLLTEPRQPRAVSASLLAEMTSDLAKSSHVIPDPSEALRRAIELARPEDAVFATGSLYLVGDLRGEISILQRKISGHNSPAPASSSRSS